MNILQIQARLKDLSDQQLQQVMQQGSGIAPEYLVLSELNRRAGMRQSQAASQPIDNTTVAQEVMAAPGLPQAVGNQMAQAMRPEDAQQSTARFAEGGIVGLQGGGFPPLPVPKPDYVAMTPEQAEIKKSVDDFVAKLQAQYGSDSAPSPALSDTDARFAESFGITDRGDLATPMVLYDGNLGTRVGSNGRQDFEADDALFRLGYDPGRMFIADTTGPNHMGPMAYAPEGASSDSGLRAPDDSIISTPMFDYAAPAYAHEFRHRGLRDLVDTYQDASPAELATLLGKTSDDPERDAAELKDFLRTVAGTGAHASYGANEGFVESYDNPETRLRYPSKVTRPAYATVEETLDYPVTRLDHLYQQRIAEHARRKNSPRQMVDALAKATQLKRFTQRYEDTFGQPVPEAMLNDYRVNELGLPAADADPERKKFLGLFAEGGIVQAFEPGGQIGMNSEYTLPRTGDPSALNLERLQQYEAQYGPAPTSDGSGEDQRTWGEWFRGLLNFQTDAQKRRDAYVPTVEDSNMFGYAEGGIVQAYGDGGILGELNRDYTPGEIAAMLRARGASTPLNPSGIVMPSPLALPPLPPALPEPRTPAPRRRGVLEGIGNAVGSAASGGMNYGISPNAGTIIPDLNLPPVDVGLLGQSLANQDYYRQGKELGLTPQQTSEAMSRGVPIEGLGQYKLDFVAEPISLGSADVVLPEPPTPTAPAPTPVVTPTAKTTPAPPAVVTPPTSTVAAPSISLPAAAPAPKFDEKAYTQAVSSFGVPGGVSDLTREGRRNAMLALAKAGFALAGSKEVTAGGAIGEAAKTGIDAYEAGAKGIEATREARRREGIAQARQQMLDRQAMSKEQFDRYYKMQGLEQQRAAATAKAERDALSAELDLMRTGAAIDSSKATAERYKQAEERQRAEATLRYVGSKLESLTGPAAQSQFQASLKGMKEGQRRTAIDARNAEIETLQAQMNSAYGVLSGGMGASEAPSQFDFGVTPAFQGE